MPPRTLYPRWLSFPRKSLTRREIGWPVDRSAELHIGFVSCFAFRTLKLFANQATDRDPRLTRSRLKPRREIRRNSNCNCVFHFCKLYHNSAELPHADGDTRRVEWQFLCVATAAARLFQRVLRSVTTSASVDTGESRKSSESRRSKSNRETRKYPEGVT